MGLIGVKVWKFKAEILPGEQVDMNIKAKKDSQGDNAQLARARKRKAK